MTFRFTPVLLGLAPLLCLQAQEARSLRAVRTTQPIRMDGKLSESVWASAPAASGFTVNWPEFGKAAALPTEVKVLYDDRYLYVGARLSHGMGKASVVRRLHRRDQDSISDWFTVYIDSLRDRRTAWGFAVNAAGIQKDSIHTGDSMNGDTSWDGVWESVVQVDPDGWSALLKIPLSLLRIRPEAGPQTWGINFSRADHGPVRETSFWELPPRGVNAFVSRFPDLTGVEGLRPQPRREWIPYISTLRKFETAQSYDDRGWTNRVGLDAHLSLATNSQLDFTVRPDFGQVEVDAAVVNLGTYETYFPEKRPFFLEGMEIFQVAGNSLFYSRRIGHGVGDPDLATGEVLVDRPLAAEITGAGKYTAKLSSGLSVGVLGASVEQTRATLRDGTGKTFKREIDPLTNYGVVRVLQALGTSGSYIGGFGSFTRQARADGREAQSQAVDAVYKTPDRSTLAEFTLARTQAGTRIDQDQGWRGRLHLNYQWRNGWAVDFAAINASRTFDPNDVGYLGRADQQVASFTATKVWDKTFAFLRNLQWGLDGTMGRDQAGFVYQREFHTWLRTDMVNFFSLWAHVGTVLPAMDDRELRTFQDPRKKYLRTRNIPWGEIGFDTPGNRMWYLRLTTDRSWHEGGPSTDSGLFQIIKPTSALEIQLQTNMLREEGEQKYITPPDGTPDDAIPMVGFRRMSQLNQTLRVSYAWTPTFTVQLFSQWLDANWAFRDVKHYVDDWTLAPGVPTGIGTPELAKSARYWNLNVITRWEFRPGSTFFLVYTHGASTDALINDRASISPRTDLTVLQHLPSDDGIQVKFSWMFR